MTPLRTSPARSAALANARGGVLLSAVVPPHPLNESGAAVDCGLRPVAQKPRGRDRLIFLPARRGFQGGDVPLKNTWIGAATWPKSLIVERNVLTGCNVFSTGRRLTSTGRPVFSTSPVFAFCPLYLSLFLVNKERDKKEQGERQSTSQGRCLFFNPRVFTPIHRLSVECVEPVGLAIQCSQADKRGDPRIHTFFCLPLPENR